MDSSEFSASESEDDSQRAESSSAANMRLDLTRIVRDVDPPVTPRTKARGESHHVVTEMITCYAVRPSDLCDETLPLARYHMKLLTPVDIAHIFRGTGEMRGVLELDLTRGSYLILLADEAHRDPAKKQIACVQVAPCATQAMARLKIGFALNIRFPDNTSRMAKLHWLLAEDHSNLMLQLAETDHDMNEVLVACTSPDDLLFFDVHFTRNGTTLPDFVVMRASMTVGEFGHAVRVDRELIRKVHDRLYTPATRYVSDSVALESFMRYHGADARAIPSLSGPTQSHDPAREPLRGDTRAFSLARAMTPYERWQHVTKTYRASDGWYHLIPSGQLNRSAAYAAAELSANIYVNFDDSIHQATRELHGAVRALLVERHLRHCEKAVRRIKQASVPASSEFSDNEDAAYLTTDDQHVAAVDMMRGKGKQPSSEPEVDRDALLLMNFYVLHRYRSMFDANAFAGIVIPPHIMRELNGAVLKALLAKDDWEMTTYTSQYITDGLLAREANNDLVRTVHLRNWRLQCPLGFVGATLTRMIDCDVYRSILAQNQEEHSELQRALAASRATAAGMWWLWDRLFGACSSRVSNATE